MSVQSKSSISNNWADNKYNNFYVVNYIYAKLNDKLISAWNSYIGSESILIFLIKKNEVY